MTIELVLVSYLSRFLDEKASEQFEDASRQLSLDGPVTADQILDKIGVPHEEAGIFILDGQRIDRDEPIDHDGSLKIFPSIIGG